MAVPISYYLILGALLFVVGVVGVLLRRNMLVVLGAFEVAFTGVHLSWVAFAYYHGQLDGQVVVLFSLVVSVAQIGVGLALVLAFFRHVRCVDIEAADKLRW